MKIGYGEALAAPSTVGVHRIAEPTGSGRVSSTLPGSAGPSTGRGIASAARGRAALLRTGDRKSTRLNSSHSQISYAVFCLKKKKKKKKASNEQFSASN